MCSPSGDIFSESMAHWYVRGLPHWRSAVRIPAREILLFLEETYLAPELYQADTKLSVFTTRRVHTNKLQIDKYEINTATLFIHSTLQAF